MTRCSCQCNAPAIIAAARQSCALKKEQEANCSCGPDHRKIPALVPAARQQEAQHHRRQHGSRELVRADAETARSIGPTPLIRVAPALKMSALLEL